MHTFASLFAVGLNELPVNLEYVHPPLAILVVILKACMWVNLPEFLKQLFARLLVLPPYL